MYKNIFTFIVLFFSFMCTNACKKENMGNEKIYLKLDLKDSKYNSLNELGGVLYLENILIVRVNSEKFAAVSQDCSNNCITEYQAKGEIFSCPCESQFFDLNGVSLDQSTSIQKYSTDLQGNILHVYE